jgi:hypothetical protein
MDISHRPISIQKRKVENVQKQNIYLFQEYWVQKIFHLDSRSNDNPTHVLGLGNPRKL